MVTADAVLICGALAADIPALGTTNGTFWTFAAGFGCVLCAPEMPVAPCPACVVWVPDPLSSTSLQ